MDTSGGCRAGTGCSPPGAGGLGSPSQVLVDLNIHTSPGAVGLGSLAPGAGELSTNHHPHPQELGRIRYHFSGWWGHTHSLCVKHHVAFQEEWLFWVLGASLGDPGGRRNNSADEDEGGVVGPCSLPPCLGALVRGQCCRSQVDPRTPGSFSLECSLRDPGLQAISLNSGDALLQHPGKHECGVHSVPMGAVLLPEASIMGAALV